MKLISITKSDRVDKKLMARFANTKSGEKIIHFGATGYYDYTTGGATGGATKEQRTRYLSRHSKNENWNNPLTAGALSRWILWGDSKSRLENIKSFKERFNL